MILINDQINNKIKFQKFTQQTAIHYDLKNIPFENLISPSNSLYQLYQLLSKISQALTRYFLLCM